MLRWFESIPSDQDYLGVAQLGRAPDLGSGGRGFKSHPLDHSVVLWEVLLLVVIKSPYATVNGSNSAGKLTIEVSQGESVPIRCSAYNMAL